MNNNAFTIASFVLGIISIVTWCTGFISIFAGALGLIFLILSHRKGQKLSSMQMFSLVFCLLGLAIGLIYTIVVIVTVCIPIMTDPAAYEQWNNYYKSIYGIGLDEMLMPYGQ